MSKDKEAKTKVVRLTEKEERLLNFIRRSGDGLVREVNKAFTELPNKRDYLTMKRIASIIEDRCFLNFDTLIDMGFICENYAEMLVSAIQKNKNIIIVGQTGTGKTTLLNALLEYQTDVRMLVLEKVPELFIGESQKDNEELNVKIDVIETEKVSFDVMSDLLMALKQPAKRIVYNELWDTDYRLSLLTALNMGFSVIASDWVREKEWKTTFAERFEKGSRYYVESTLNKHTFVVVKTGIDGAGRKRVLSITEE